jgi:hypothetical protein
MILIRQNHPKKKFLSPKTRPATATHPERYKEGYEEPPIQGNIDWKQVCKDLDIDPKKVL